MARKRYTAEQIIGHLRQAEIRISEGKTVTCPHLCVHIQSQDAVAMDGLMTTGAGGR